MRSNAERSEREPLNGELKHLLCGLKAERNAYWGLFNSPVLNKSSSQNYLTTDIGLILDPKDMHIDLQMDTDVETYRQKYRDLFLLNAFCNYVINQKQKNKRTKKEVYLFFLIFSSW